MTDKGSPKAPDENQGAAEIIRAEAKELVKGGETTTAEQLQAIQSTYGNQLNRASEADSISEELTAAAALLEQLCTRFPGEAAQVTREAKGELDKNSGAIFKEIRTFIRNAQALIGALQTVDLDAVRREGSGYLDTWANTISQNVSGLDAKAIDAIKAFLKADQPDPSLLQGILGERGVQLRPFLSKFHTAYRKEQQARNVDIVSAEQKNALHAEGSRVLDGLGFVLTEEQIQELAALSMVDQSKNIVDQAQTLSTKIYEYLPRTTKATLFLRFGRVPVFIHGEMDADERKEELGKALEKVVQGEAGNIGHAQGFDRERWQRQFASLPAQTALKANLTLTGEEITFQKKQDGKVRQGDFKDSLGIDFADLEKRPERYLVNVRLAS